MGPVILISQWNKIRSNRVILVAGKIEVKYQDRFLTLSEVRGDEGRSA